ncbi:arginase family protein [Microbaculum marinisediminis]|uniref:Arginase family protein n=1 Tax=Microbaculum marinisediminis TaxID=2931392 RepID=A0AAW5QYR6_9HYPH|nr:arginase family protein [Microbaculum sp. A6E488]MCT8972714.1 arginase family protein [Microbaculum sp. A6E488]
MAAFSEEKRARLRALAEGEFLQSSDPAIDAFLQRMEAENAPVFSDVYAGDMTFFNAPRKNDLDQVDLALVGIPFEASAPVRAGTRLGPRSFREWSKVRGPVHDVWKTIPFELLSVADIGDISFESPHDVASCVQTIQETFSGFRRKGITPFSVGGVHTMSHPILTGLASGEGVGLVQIDAHADTARGSFQGDRLNDCRVFLNAMLDEAIDPERTIQIGMRGSLSPYWDFSKEAGARIIPMHECYDLGVSGLLDEIRSVIGDGPFYFSLDTDGIDATYLPGTQLPEPFGFTTREVVQIIRGMRGMDIVGADIVELCPPYDPNGISANIAAALGFEMVCLLAEAHVARNGQTRKTHWR